MYIHKRHRVQSSPIYPACVWAQSLSPADSLGPRGLQPAMLLCPSDFPGKKLEWVAISSSRGAPRPRDRNFVSWIAGRLFTMVSSFQFSSVTQSCPILRPNEQQNTRPPCPSPTPGVHPNPGPSNRWCHPTVSSSVVPFSSCPQSFPASGSFPMSQLSASGGQSTGVSASASVLPVNTQDWSPLGWTGWISLQSKGLSRVFSTTVQKHQFFGNLLSL